MGLFPQRGYWSLATQHPAIPTRGRIGCEAVAPIVRRESIMEKLIAGMSLLLFAGIAGAQPGPGSAKTTTPAALKAEIEALKAPQVAWRRIPWKSCLLEGLKESREQQK